MSEKRRKRVPKTDTWVPLAALLSIARECKGWSLRKLADECGVHNALISQMETGHIKEPSFTNVVRVCDALGIPLERAAAAVRAPTSSILRYKQWRSANADMPATRKTP